MSKAAVERLYLGLAADLRPDNIAVNCLSPSRVVLTAGWQAAGGGEIPADMVEPPETMGQATALLAALDGAGITGTVQRSETLLATGGFRLQRFIRDGVAAVAVPYGIRFGAGGPRRASISVGEPV